MYRMAKQCNLATSFSQAVGVAFKRSYTILCRFFTITECFAERSKLLLEDMFYYKISML